MKKIFTDKPTRRVFRTLLILLMVSLFTTGCGQKSEFEKGFDYTFTPDSMMFGIKSDTDTFSKNDVTFDLYYGDTVTVTRSDLKVSLLRVKEESFYSKIRMKKFV